MDSGNEKTSENNNNNNNNNSNNCNDASSNSNVFDDAIRRISSISIHPGHFFLCTSIPFCIQAYKGYHTPLDHIVQNVLQKSSSTTTSIISTKASIDKIKDDGIRRALGSAVAARALKVATTGSIGIFGISTAIIFYISGCTTMNDAIVRTQNWAHYKRKHIDTFFGVTDRVDRDHPEYIITQSMTEDEELHHVQKTYLPTTDDNTEEESSYETTTK